MPKTFTLYTFTVAPHVPAYAADLAARAGTFTIRATGDRTVADLCEVFETCGFLPFTSPSLAVHQGHGRVRTHRTIDSLGLGPADELVLAGLDEWSLKVRAVEPGAVRGTLPPTADPGDFDVEWMEELAADDWDRDADPDRGPTEVYRLAARGTIVQKTTGRALTIDVAYRWDGEVRLGLFPSLIAMWTGNVIPVTAGRLSVPVVGGGPRVYQGAEYARWAGIRLDAVPSARTDLVPGSGDAAVAGVVYAVDSKDLPGYQGVVTFTVVGNGDYWKYRDQARAGGEPGRR